MSAANSRATARIGVRDFVYWVVCRRFRCVVLDIGVRRRERGIAPGTSGRDSRDGRSRGWIAGGQGRGGWLVSMIVAVRGTSLAFEGLGLFGL